MSTFNIGSITIENKMKLTVRDLVEGLEDLLEDLEGLDTYEINIKIDGKVFKFSDIDISLNNHTVTFDIESSKDFDESGLTLEETIDYIYSHFSSNHHVHIHSGACSAHGELKCYDIEDHLYCTLWSDGNDAVRFNTKEIKKAEIIYNVLILTLEDGSVLKIN